MERFNLYTLVDITKTNARRGEDKLAYGQQQNYMSMMQTLGLRTNVEISNPTYATAVGLVMNARDNYVNNDEKLETMEVENETQEIDSISGTLKQKSIFEKFTEKLKKFLENAE